MDQAQQNTIQDNNIEVISQDDTQQNNENQQTKKTLKPEEDINQSQNNPEKQNQNLQQNDKNITQDSKEALKEIFNKFDQDKSGQIDYKEIKNIAKELQVQINEKEVNNIFKELDLNKDGKIDFEEFWSWWGSGRPNKLEAMVYYKLKYLKLLKKANANFTRLGGSLEEKYGTDLESQYIALNYGENKGNLRVDVEAFLQHPDTEQEIIKLSNQMDLNLEETKNGFSLVLQFKTTHHQQEELKQLLSNIIEELKEIIGTLAGPEILILVEALQINIKPSNKDKVLVQIYAEESLIQDFLENDQIQMLKQMLKSAQTHFQFSFGLKNSLQSILQNPEKKFVKTLLEGFLLESKLIMNKQFFKQIRNLITQYLEQKEKEGKKISKNKVEVLTYLSMLHSSKFHVTFKNMDDIEQIFSDLGIQDLAEEQPGNIEFIEDMSEQLLEMGLMQILIGDEFPFKDFFTKLSDLCSGEFGIVLLHDNNLINIQLNAIRISQIYQKIIDQALEYYELQQQQ